MVSQFEKIEVLDDATAEVLRTMTTAEHLSIANRIWKYAHDMLTDAVAREHADWTETELQYEVARRISDPAFEEWASKNIPSSHFLQR